MCVIGRKRGINKSVKFYSEIWPFGERPRKRGGGELQKQILLPENFMSVIFGWTLGRKGYGQMVPT